MHSLMHFTVGAQDWPRILNSLRQAGLYLDCDCSGCASCLARAQRFLRGAGQGARYSAPYRPEHFGRQYPVFTRQVGKRRIHILTDRAAAAPSPAVIDVMLELGVETEARDYGKAKEKTLPLIRTETQAIIGRGDWSEPMPLLSLRAAKGKATEITRTDNALLDKCGLYMFLEPTGRSQEGFPTYKPLYIGKVEPGRGEHGDKRTFRSRLHEHRVCIERFRHGPSPQLYFVLMPLTANIRQMEHRLLQHLVYTWGQANKPSGHDLGYRLTNRSTELEFGW